MLATALVGFVGGAGCTLFASRASQGFGGGLREGLFRACLRLDAKGRAKLPVATLITRLLNDVGQLQASLLILLRILVRAPLLVIGGIILVVAIDPRLAAKVLWPLPLLALGLYVILSRSFPLFERVQARLDAMTEAVRENLAGVRVVKAFLRGPEETARFERKSGDLAETSVRANRAMGGSLPLVQLLLNLSMVALVGFGGLEVASGDLPAGQWIALVNYLTQILLSLLMSAMMLMSVSRSGVSARRVREVLDAAGAEAPAVPPVAPASAGLAFGARGAGDFASVAISPKGPARFKPVPRPPGPAIEFRGVTFTYPGAGQPSLRDVSFRLESGGSLGILGSTGSGKSTLLSLLLREFDPDRGVILADGQDLRDIDLVEWRKRLGWVPQAPAVFSGTLRGNIGWGDPEAADAEIERAARIAQLDGFIRSLPAGYETPAGQRGIGLSGGQRQRLSIARALVRRPRLLLLDDAASALDYVTEARLRRLLGASLEGATRISVALRIRSVEDCDRILVLEDGASAGFGTHAELLVRNAVYGDLARSQGLLETAAV